MLYVVAVVGWLGFAYCAVAWWLERVAKFVFVNTARSNGEHLSVMTVDREATVGECKLTVGERLERTGDVIPRARRQRVLVLHGVTMVTSGAEVKALEATVGEMAREFRE
jgi:hypothetical protein